MTDELDALKAATFGTVASVVMRRVTSSPTIGANRPTPKSLRLIVAVASKPIAGTFFIGCSEALLRVASSTTTLVMPLMVRSPVIFSLPVPAASTLVLLKVATGNFSASKKSALRRCALNLSLKPLRPDSGRVTATLDLVTSAAS